MELSIKSWHAKVYNFFYLEDLPKSLCPYFWKLVLAIFVLIPFLITVFLGSIALIITLIVYLFHVKLSLFFSWHHFEMLLIFIGIVAVVVSVILSIGYIVSKITDRYNNKKKYFVSKSKVKNPTILQEFVKAKYNKYCPKINWQ